jgi:hypothetical protein
MVVRNRFNEELAAFLNESVKNNDKQAARDDGGMWGPTVPSIH